MKKTHRKVLWSIGVAWSFFAGCSNSGNGTSRLMCDPNGQCPPGRFCIDSQCVPFDRSQIAINLDAGADGSPVPRDTGLPPPPPDVSAPRDHTSSNPEASTCDSAIVQPQVCQHQIGDWTSDGGASLPL